MIPRGSVVAEGKPVAEVVVEGELSPFEDEALYRILRKSFQVDHPTYTQLLDEELSTRVNVLFHHPYSATLFSQVFQENWRELKDLLKQVRYRRGRAGAAFTLTFNGPVLQFVFKCGVLEESALGSALDQIGHLTGVIGQMLRPDTMDQALVRIESTYDKRSDRWNDFRGSTSSAEESYVFDESVFRWVRS